MNNAIKSVMDFIARNITIAILLFVVILTVINKDLTFSIMVEVFGYGMLTFLIAQIGTYVYTKNKFTEHHTTTGASDPVLGDIIKASAIVVGMCVAGMYFAKSDGATAIHTTLQSELDSIAIPDFTYPSRDTGSHRP